MRKKILVSVLFLIIFISFNLNAQSYYPLQVEIVPTPSQIYQQTVRDAQQLQMQRQQEYDQHQALLEQARQNWEDASNKVLSMPKIAACSYTYTSIHSKFSEMLKDNMADLYTIKKDTSYLNILYSSYQKCVSEAAQAAQMAQKQNQAPQLINNQICTDYYGPNATFKELDPTDGGRICGCQIGYTWNDQRTSCIVAPIISVKTNESTLPSGCSSNQGYSATNGVPCGGEITKSTITCNGKEWSDCPIGQKFYCPSTGDAQCTIVSKAITPTTKKVLKVKEDTSSIAKLDPINFTKLPQTTGVVISGNELLANNQDKIKNMVTKLETSPITQTNPEPAKTKSFWTRVKGWFGF